MDLYIVLAQSKHNLCNVLTKLEAASNSKVLLKLALLDNH